LLLAGKTFFRRVSRAAIKGDRMNIVPDYRGYGRRTLPLSGGRHAGSTASAKKGEILEVVSDCPQSINNIPVDARNHGYTVLDIQQDGPTIRYLIQK
jgi:hypothetical protein